MLKASEKKTLTSLLALAPEPEQTFTLNELMGFMFGLAMTPDMILPSEWLPIIFGGDTPVYDSLEQMKEMSECLIGVYNNLTDDFHKDKLKFPFDINKIKDKQLEKLYEWVSGFEEALILREELWDPEENPELSGKAKEELYHSMMTVQGLIDPIEVMDFFNNLPDEAFEEAFPGMQTDGVNRESLIQVFLMASLPLAVETFQNHARTLEKKRQQQLSPPSQLDQARSTKIGRNDPCPCNSGKKYKKCCGDLTHPKAAGASGGSAKKSNVIKVDFPQHGKKKQQTPAPIYQLKVGLEGAKPPIWRRIQVPGNTTLDDLHEIIQLCMGWTNSHLHMFIIDKTSYSIPHEDDDWIADNLQNESEFTLHALKNKIQPHFQYIYDFGDDWIHKVTVEKTLPPEEGKPYPLLITGRRACPPEDVGGIYGFMDMLKTLQNPKDEEYEELIEWLGDYFDPAEFHKDEKKAINEILKELYLQST